MMENLLCSIMTNHTISSWRKMIMPKCPKCGSEGKMRKSWKMAGRPDKSGKRMQLEIGLYNCPKCDKPFRVVLNKKKI
jgi:ssDNA-binding Zn-finger/Zn-ribbon topoisomerase 1